MDERAVAETVGAHLVLTSPTAEVWRRVAHGELSPDEGAARVLAGREAQGAIEPEELERAKLVFAPVAAERREQLFRELVARRREGEVVVSLGTPATKERSGIRTRWVIGLAVAAAAVLVLALVPARPRQRFDEVYDLEITRMADVRSSDVLAPAPASVPRFELDDMIRIVLRPEQAVDGAVDVVGFARSRGGEPRRLELEPEIEASGFVELRTTARELALDEGTWELQLVVGRKGALPDAWVETDAGAGGYIVLRQTIEIAPRQP